MEKSLLEQMTIEQFRQNLALLKAEEIEMPKKWVLELLNTIEALQQENEQLQAQVARVKNAIQYVLYHLRRGGKSWIIDKLEPAISGTPADYHNPADVEALRKARNLLQRYKDHIKSYPCECKFGLDFYGNKTPFRDGEMCERCAELAAIDKVIGGKEE